MDLTSGQKDVMMVLDRNFSLTTRVIVDRLETRTGNRNIWTYDRVHSILKRLERREIVRRTKRADSHEYFVPSRWRRTKEAHEAFIQQFG